ALMVFVTSGVLAHNTPAQLPPQALVPPDVQTPPQAGSAIVQQLPPPDPGCLPTGEPNSWYCHGIPDPAPADHDQHGQAIDDIGRRQFPELYNHGDRMPPLPDKATLRGMHKQEMRGLIKSRNPRAVFAIAGHDVDEVTQILDRDADDLA